MAAECRCRRAFRVVQPRVVRTSWIRSDLALEPHARITAHLQERTAGADPAFWAHGGEEVQHGAAWAAQSPKSLRSVSGPLQALELP